MSTCDAFTLFEIGKREIEWRNFAACKNEARAKLLKGVSCYVYCVPWKPHESVIRVLSIIGLGIKQLRK